ncbi:MAG: 30S ribosomal protein S20 [Planctomycetales bacterium]|nr:30S ribosomal protein S20 [Planctomycetales bacterium]
MPTNQNAKKALRQSAKHRIRNRATRTALKTTLKKAREATTGTDAQAGQAALQMAAKHLDQAAAKGQIHPNKAARLKSRLNKALNKSTMAAK